jgi:hypothetical protein
VTALAARRAALIAYPGGVVDEHDAWVVDVARPRPAPPPAKDAPGETRTLVPPDAEAVRRRARALVLGVWRGLVERERPPEPERALAGLRRRAADLAADLEPEEAAFLAAGLGEPRLEAVARAVWRAEGAAVLAWALGRLALPAVDAVTDVRALSEAVELRGSGTPPSLRPRHELTARRNRCFAAHWRLQGFHARPGHLDFRQFARIAWFGPLDISELPLCDDDLALAGQPLHASPRERVRMALSVARERHQASEWLLGAGAIYSRVDTST